MEGRECRARRSRRAHRLNLYSYCGGDPVNRTDSSGLFWGKLFHAIGKIVAVVNRVLKWVIAAGVVAVAVVAVVVSPATACAMVQAIGAFLMKIGIIKAAPIGSLLLGTETGHQFGRGWRGVRRGGDGRHRR